MKAFRISSIILILCGLATAGYTTYLLIYDFVGGLLLSYIFAYIIALLDLISGVLGLIYFNKKEKSRMLVIIGMIVTCVSVLWLIPEVLTDYQILNWYIYGYSVLFAIIFYVCAKQNETK